MEAQHPRLTCTVYLQTPKVFQSLMVLSLEPETIWRLSEEKATLRTSLVWPTKRRVVVPLKEERGNERSHKFCQGGKFKYLKEKETQSHLQKAKE